MIWQRVVLCMGSERAVRGASYGRVWIMSGHFLAQPVRTAHQLVGSTLWSSLCISWSASPCCGQGMDWVPCIYRLPCLKKCGRPLRQIWHSFFVV